MKEAFKGTWELSAQKEAFVKDSIERCAGVKVLDVGFGAGSTEYIKGSSGSHGFDKAAPDLKVEGTNLVIEVSGPLRSMSQKADLLVNTSKVEYALEHPELEYWFAHSNGVTRNREGVRMIRIGKQFRQGMDRGEICYTQFESRGMQQMFWSIPADHYTVCRFDTFLMYLQDRKTK